MIDKLGTRFSSKAILHGGCSAKCLLFVRFFVISKAWFSLAHKHKDIRTRRMAYSTQFSIPALLNPMIKKMADEASALLLLICEHEVWVKVTYDWFTALC